MKNLNPQLLKFGLPVLLLVLYLGCGLLFPPPAFVRDSAYYWDLRRAFFDQAGHFTLTNYADDQFQLRGYVFPLILLAFETLIDLLTPDRWLTPALTVLLLNAAIFLSVGWFLLPELFSRLTAQPVSAAFRLSVGALLFFFWRGFLVYPLSDFPALALLLAGLLAAWEGASARNSLARAGLLAFGAGALTMAAYLTRPAYLLALPAAWLVLLLGRPQPWRRRLFWALIFLAGAALLLWPQYLINRQQYGLNSPFISDKLYAFHIENGFVVQRFEVNTNPQTYPLPNARFYDLQAQALLSRAGLPGLTLQALPGLFWAYPLEVSSVYFRHLFNGLTPFYDSPYVKDILAPDFWLMWGSYTLCFTALTFFDWRRLLTANFWKKAALLAAWLLPVVTAIPAVTEVRFYLPLNAFLLVVFAALIFSPGLRRPGLRRQDWLGLTLSYAVFLLLCFALAGQIFLSLGKA